MKYVFTVHSPITFLSAYAVIEKLALSSYDVVLLTLDYEVPINRYRSFPSFSSLKTVNVPSRADCYLNDMLDGESFYAFIDLMSFNQRILISNSKCLGFHFIEEGNSSYRCNDTLEDLTWDKRGMDYRVSNNIVSMTRNVIQSVKWAVRGYNHRLMAIPYSFSSYHDFPNVRFYGFSAFAYPQIKNEKKVILTLGRGEDIHKMAGGISLRDAIIWIDGSNGRFTGLPEEDYHHAIDKAVIRLNRELKERKVHVKLRPGIQDHSSNYLYSALRNAGADVHVLPDNLIIECVLINSDNCVVVGNLSSVLFYAAVFGHKSYSIFSLFRTKVATIFDQMPGYWQMIEKL